MEENTFQMVYFFFFFWRAVWSDPLEGGESTEMERLVTITFFGEEGGISILAGYALSLSGREYVFIFSSKRVFDVGIRDGCT